STRHTVGPWAATDQHGGPPAALLVRALERVLPVDGWLARISVDLLSAIPVADLTVSASVVRPGRSVQLAVATLAAGGRDVARATGWWHRLGDTAAVASTAGPPPLPDQADPVDDRWPGGYLRAMEWRRVKGDFAEPGPAVIWSRMRIPLVEGEQPSSIQRRRASCSASTPRPRSARPAAATRSPRCPTPPGRSAAARRPCWSGLGERARRRDRLARPARSAAAGRRRAGPGRGARPRVRGHCGGERAAGVSQRPALRAAWTGAGAD